MAISNPMADVQSFRHQKYEGESHPILNTDIVARVKGQDKNTLLYFPPSHLEKAQEKWGKENLIFLKNAPKKRRKTSQK